MVRVTFVYLLSAVLFWGTIPQSSFAGVSQGNETYTDLGQDVDEGADRIDDAGDTLIEWGDRLDCIQGVPNPACDKDEDKDADIFDIDDPDWEGVVTQVGDTVISDFNRMQQCVTNTFNSTVNKNMSLLKQKVDAVMALENEITTIDDDAVMRATQAMDDFNRTHGDLAGTIEGVTSQIEGIYGVGEQLTDLKYLNYLLMMAANGEDLTPEELAMIEAASNRLRNIPDVNKTLDDLELAISALGVLRDQSAGTLLTLGGAAALYALVGDDFDGTRSEVEALLVKYEEYQKALQNPLDTVLVNLDSFMDILGFLDTSSQATSILDTPLDENLLGEQLAWLLNDSLATVMAIADYIEMFMRFAAAAQVAQTFQTALSQGAAALEAAQGVMGLVQAFSSGKISGDSLRSAGEGFKDLASKTRVTNASLQTGIQQLEGLEDRFVRDMTQGFRSVQSASGQPITLGELISVFRQTDFFASIVESVKSLFPGDEGQSGRGLMDDVDSAKAQADDILNTLQTLNGQNINQASGTLYPVLKQAEQTFPEAALTAKNINQKTAKLQGALNDLVQGSSWIGGDAGLSEFDKNDTDAQGELQNINSLVDQYAVEAKIFADNQRTAAERIRVRIDENQAMIDQDNLYKQELADEEARLAQLRSLLSTEQDQLAQDRQALANATTQDQINIFQGAVDYQLQKIAQIEADIQATETRIAELNSLIKTPEEIRTAEDYIDKGRRALVSISDVVDGVTILSDDQLGRLEQGYSAIEEVKTTTQEIDDSMSQVVEAPSKMSTILENGQATITSTQSIEDKFVKMQNLLGMIQNNQNLLAAIQSGLPIQQLLGCLDIDLDKMTDKIMRVVRGFVDDKIRWFAHQGFVKATNYVPFMMLPEHIDYRETDRDLQRLLDQRGSVDEDVFRGRGERLNTEKVALGSSLQLAKSSSQLAALFPKSLASQEKVKNLAMVALNGNYRSEARLEPRDTLSAWEYDPELLVKPTFEGLEADSGDFKATLHYYPFFKCGFDAVDSFCWYKKWVCHLLYCHYHYSIKPACHVSMEYKEPTAFVETVPRGGTSHLLNLQFYQDLGKVDDYRGDRVSDLAQNQWGLGGEDFKKSSSDNAHVIGISPVARMLSDLNPWFANMTMACDLLEKWDRWPFMAVPGRPTPELALLLPGVLTAPLDLINWNREWFNSKGALFGLAPTPLSAVYISEADRFNWAPTFGEGDVPFSDDGGKIKPSQRRDALSYSMGYQDITGKKGESPSLQGFYMPKCRSAQVSNELLYNPDPDEVPEPTCTKVRRTGLSLWLARIRGQSEYKCVWNTAQEQVDAQRAALEEAEAEARRVVELTDTKSNICIGEWGGLYPRNALAVKHDPAYPWVAKALLSWRAYDRALELGSFSKWKKDSRTKVGGLGAAETEFSMEWPFRTGRFPVGAEPNSLYSQARKMSGDPGRVPAYQGGWHPKNAGQNIVHTGGTVMTMWKDSSCCAVTCCDPWAWNPSYSIANEFFLFVWHEDSHKITMYERWK